MAKLPSTAIARHQRFLPTRAESPESALALGNRELGRAARDV